MLEIFVGWDAREVKSYQVCVRSLKTFASQPTRIRPLLLADMQAQGLYKRPTERRGYQLWDVISDAPMSTEFALTRFLVPMLGSNGWALFCDCDFLWRADVADLFAAADPQYAVMCVKHEHKPTETMKMDGQRQTAYRRKNWSSLMLFNCAHPSNKLLTLEMFNSVRGLNLHEFYWLDDEEIGDLDPRWNDLEGVTDAANPKAVHYTRGTPELPGYENARFADQWRACLEAVNGV